MEEYLKDLLYSHRSKLAKLDVETLISPLLNNGVLTTEDVKEIRLQPTSTEKIFSLLDIIASRGSDTYQTFFNVLESVSPHILTMMLTGGSPKPGTYRRLRQGSNSTVVASDGECDGKISPASLAGSEGNETRRLPDGTSRAPRPAGAIIFSDGARSNPDGSRLSLTDGTRVKHDGTRSIIAGVLPQSDGTRSINDGAMPFPAGAFPLPDDSLPFPDGVHGQSGENSPDLNILQLLKAELKVVTKERDLLKKEMKRTLKERDETNKQIGSNSQSLGVSDPPSYNTVSKQVSSSSVTAENSTSREVDTLNLRYEKSLLDVQIFKKQNLELNRKYDSTVKDLDFCRKQERATYSNLQTLRRQYDEITVDKCKLEKDVSSLQKLLEESRKEIGELRRQQEETISLQGSDEGVNQLYVATFRKYEALKTDYENVKKRYSDLAATHSSHLAKLEAVQEDVNRLSKKCEEVAHEKSCMTQQCTEAIRQWDSALREKNKLQEELLKFRERNEELLKEMNVHLVQSQNLNKEFKRLQGERNAAMREYSLVMSERDTVHKEMDKMQEELNVANSKIKAVEKCSFDGTKERESLILQLETLKREIASSLNDRDKAIRECSELRDRYGATDESAKQWGDVPIKDYDTYKQEREMKRKEAGDLSGPTPHELFTKAQKERLDDLDQANQELDRLRKSAEKLQSDLEEAKREAEVSQRRRDWAFGERDKIVLERESIRAHCDKLRHERDRAVSDLAEALRDSDDMMKQRNEASKQLKELKEKLEADSDKLSAIPRAVPGVRNVSRDSAIDTDMHDWEIETMQIQLGVVSSERELGLEVSGGSEDPHYGGTEPYVYVSFVAKEGPFHGKLRLHDHILRVNGIDCGGSSPSGVYAAILKCRSWVQLTVRRRRVGGASKGLRTVHLHCPTPSHHGLVLQTGVYISSILPGSPAAREGSLAVGDRILNVNGRAVDSSATGESVQALLNCSGEMLQLTTLRAVGSTSLSGPLSSSSSGHNMTEDDKMAVAASIAPMKESSNQNRQSKELALKLRGEEKRHGSSERVVYNVTKPPDEKTEKFAGTWGQIKNIVKPRRHSKERPDVRNETRDKDDHYKKKDNRDKENAIAMLDSVLENHENQYPGNTATTKRPKKRDDKVNSGGTWPKYRGSCIVTLGDINMGTIKPPPSQRKERPPLSMYIPSLTHNKYSSLEQAKNSNKNAYSNNSRISMIETRSVMSSPGPQLYSVSRSRNSSGFHPYSDNEIYSHSRSLTNHNQPVYSPDSNRGESASIKEENVLDRKQQDRQNSPDASIDFSVKSGNVGKEELEYYVKKNLGGGIKYQISDSESSSLNLQPSSLPPVHISRPSPVHHAVERVPSNSRIPHTHTGLYSPPSASLRMSPFSPYAPYSFHQHNHPHTVHGPLPSYPSPTYCSPPLPILAGSPHLLSPSRSGDSVFSSPVPDRNPQDVRNFYENQIAPSPTNSGVINSVITSLEGLGNQQGKRGFHSHHPHGPRASSDEPPPHIVSSLPPPYYDYQRTVSTIPRKKESDRIRIPSNSSITSPLKTSRPITPHGVGLSEMRPEDQEFNRSERNSPMSAFPITQISHSVHHQLPSHRKKVQPGDIRNIYIEKDSEPLGIQIRCLSNGGVFVASVTLASIAEKVGICVGDQLLEVCGINMRSATKELAASVLSQCGNFVTILVQFNPEKYHETDCWEGSSSGGSIILCSPSGATTPQNSPGNSRASPLPDEDVPNSGNSTLKAPLNAIDCVDSTLPASAHSTLTRPQSSHVISLLNRQEGGGSQASSDNKKSSPRDDRNHSSSHPSPPSANQQEATRRIHIEMPGCHNLGVQMVGGNALGIFVHAVSPDSPAAQSDLRPGDRILEFNGIDLRLATAEQAACELSKPAERIAMLVQWSFQTYSEIKDQPGDSFYVRALFTRAEQADPMSLAFRKGDILFVDNTLFNNVLGQWRAWLVSEDGHKRVWGVIPSKEKVEEEMLSHRHAAGGELSNDSSRRSSTTARRSFFKRKKHSRSSSRDSKELASFSDASLNAFSSPDAAVSPEDAHHPVSYVRVERLDYLVRRPVVLVGPLWELVCEKLCHDFPHQFVRCFPDIHRGPVEDLEGMARNGIVVDYRRRGAHFETVTVAQVKDICDKKNCHGILDIGVGTVVRLQQHNIYPIVLILKFKHHKHIRDISDSYYGVCEKLSQKEAKEMFDLTNKIDQENKHLVSAEITAGVNISYICAQVKAIVDTEQSKTLWVPTSAF